MSASLVGSEMCIRDRERAATGAATLLELARLRRAARRAVSRAPRRRASAGGGGRGRADRGQYAQTAHSPLRT
eukprot:5190003-Alexandrium_andersonii.AAC.1